MRMTQRSMVSAAALIVCTQILPAQQQSNNAGPTVYGSSVSYHVPDETRGAFETWLKDKYRKYAEAMLKEDPTIQSVSVTRVIYGGVKEPEANFYITMFQSKVPEPRTAMQNKVCQQLFGKSYADFSREAYPLRKRLGQTLSRRMTGAAGGTAPVEGDVIRLDYKKVAAGRMGDYMQLERDYTPLREAQVKAGKMKSWSMNAVVLPQGTEREYDAYTVHTGKDLEQILTWGSGQAALAAQLNPPFNAAGMAMRANDIAKTVRAETRVYVMRVARN